MKVGKRDVLRYGLPAAVLAIQQIACGGLDESRTAAQMLRGWVTTCRVPVMNPQTGRTEQGLFVVSFKDEVRLPQDGLFWSVFIQVDGEDPVFADWGIDKLVVSPGHQMFLQAGEIIT